MGFLSKIFGGKSKESAAQTALAMDCPHAVLVPRWENVADMGREDKVSRYMCEACHEEFDPAKAAELSDTINERMEASWEAQVADESSTEKA